MMHYVECGRTTCKHNFCSECYEYSISIDEYGDCENFEDYRHTQEYSHKFYRAVKPDENSPMSKKADWGKKYEINGYTFFTTDNTSFPEAEAVAILTESRTGANVGGLSFVKEHFEELRKGIDAHKIDVESLPDIIQPEREYILTCNCYMPPFREDVKVKATDLEKAWKKAKEKAARKYKAKIDDISITACQSI